MRILNSRKYREALSYILNASRRHRLNLFRAFLEFLNVSLRKKFSPLEIYSFDLLSPQWTPKEKDEMVSKEMHLRHQQKVNPAEYGMLTEDKVVFHRYCRGVGLPLPPLVAVMNRFGASFDAAFSPIACFEDFDAAITNHGADIICKPVYGTHGDDIVGFNKTPGGYQCVGGAFPSLRHFYDHLQTGGKDQEFIIQEKLNCHREIVDLTGKHQVQGLRLITAVDDHQEPHLILHKIKLAGTVPLLDNFQFGQAGALLCLLDKTGKIIQAYTHSPEKKSLVTIKHHPDNGKELIGFQVPDWQNCVALALEAQRHFMPHKTIGWDIAVTDHGPCLLEGNIYWDPNIPYEGPMKSLSRKYGIG